jgi:uncharacterized repeat protein (TIGR03833 family)
MISIIESTKIGLKHYHRSKIKIGMKVMIVRKEDQKSGVMTKGHIAKILTNKSYHDRGIKVMLRDGTVGRVQRILT